MQEHQSPINPIPPLVLIVFGVVLAIEAAFSLGELNILGGSAAAWRVQAIQDYAYAPEALRLIMNGNNDPSLWLRLIAYPFVHASFTHAVFASILWLALGKFASEFYRPWAVATIFIASTLMGALAYGVYGIWMKTNVPLLGFYPSDFGMIGAFTYLSWVRLGHEGNNRFQAFAMISVLMGLQVVYSVLFGSNPTWVADIAGFVTGGVAAILVAPGGWRRFLELLRKR